MSTHDPRHPSLLVSYVFLGKFLELRGEYSAFREWVLDSGAFSAYQSGTPIDVNTYIETCLSLRDGPDPPSTIFALDVIGDEAETRRNYEAMVQAGISEAVPTYHFGESESWLRECATYPKMALGGVARMNLHKKLRWAEQCFSRVWPTKIHGFGFSAEQAIMSLPFHSADATSWMLGPCRHQHWKAYGQDIPYRGSGQDLSIEVQWYLDLEKKARHRWRKQMAEIGATPGSNPSLSLAIYFGNLRERSICLP